MNAPAIIHQKNLVVLDVHGEDWQRRLWFGEPSVGWQGDSSLQLLHHPLTNEVLIKQAHPGERQVLVMKISLDTFDIHKACEALANADTRTRSADSIMQKVDDHNDLFKAETLKAAKEKTAAGIDRLAWAIGRDAGGSIPPQTITKGLPDGTA